MVAGTDTVVKCAFDMQPRHAGHAAEVAGQSAAKRPTAGRFFRALKPRCPACRYYRGVWPHVSGALWLTLFEHPGRCCPECEHKGYMFRARRALDGKPGESGAVETKYRCRSCAHEWRERTSAPAGPKRADEAA